jgi:hypothetical protein
LKTVCCLDSVKTVLVVSGDKIVKEIEYCNKELNKEYIARQNSSLSSIRALKVRHKGGGRLSRSNNKQPILITRDPF